MVFKVEVRLVFFILVFGFYFDCFVLGFFIIKYFFRFLNLLKYFCRFFEIDDKNGLLWNCEFNYN